MSTYPSSRAMRDDFILWLYEEIIDLICEAYESGMSIEEIAEEWEIDKEVVMQIIMEKKQGKTPKSEIH